ncbi:Epidermal retinol dehydrogenase 2, partial [Temnothorax longispinosus]
YEGYDINTTVVCPYFIRSTGMFDDVQSRYIPTLSPNAVADRIIMAMRCNEKYTIIPGYLQILLTLKWIFPWPCVAMFLRGLVRDASPGHEDSKFIAATRTATVAEEECTVPPSKDPNSATIHQQLARRISSSERKP